MPFLAARWTSISCHFIEIIAIDAPLIPSLQWHQSLLYRPTPTGGDGGADLTCLRNQTKQTHHLNKNCKWWNNAFAVIAIINWYGPVTPPPPPINHDIYRWRWCHSYREGMVMQQWDVNVLGTFLQILWNNDRRNKQHQEIIIDPNPYHPHRVLVVWYLFIVGS